MSSRISRIVLGLSALILAALLAGCSELINPFTAEESFARSFDVTGAPRIVVETFNGRVEARAGAEGTVSVEGTKRGSGATQSEAEADLKNVEVSMTQEGATIRIVARRIDNTFNTGNSGASFELSVPAGATLDLRSSNGSITAEGVTGGVTMESSNGELQVRGGQGRQDLRTSNGRIHIEAESAEVDAHTSNGEIVFEGSLAEGNHTFETSNGGIEITLPAEARFRIDASTSNGKVSTDFPVTMTGTQDDNTLRGTVGESASVSIRAATSNGRIEIRQGR